MTIATKHAVIKSIEFHVPENLVTNEMLAEEFQAWNMDKIEAKTGIKLRYMAAADETASDLGVRAAKKLFEKHSLLPENVNFILFCTQSPDYLLPTTACLMQDQLGIPTSAGALDFNLGCSGFIYGLGMAKGLIETGQAENVLLITAETYSKFIHPEDKSVRTIFGDAAAAIWVGSEIDRSNIAPFIGPFVYGTDGSGGEHLIVPHGGMRHPISTDSSLTKTDADNNVRAPRNLHMNGSEVFSFTLNSVPKMFKALLKRSGLSIEELDLIVFHQANKFMLEHLRKKMKIPEEKFHLSYQNYGNTVSSTIPIGLWSAQQEGRLTPGGRVALAGFGVGYSWAATVVRFPTSFPQDSGGKSGSF